MPRVAAGALLVGGAEPEASAVVAGADRDGAGATARAAAAG